MFKKGITYYTLGLITMIWLWLFFLKSSISEYKEIKIVKTDTVYVDKPYKEIVIKEVEIEKPVKIFIYKTDTFYRQKLERDTLISAIKINPRLATIHSITPKGIPLVKKYPLINYEEIQIDNEGNLKIRNKKARRKRLWRNLERATLILGGLYLGSNLTK